MEKPLEVAWVGPHAGRGGVSENHLGRAISVSQVDGNLDMALTWIYEPAEVGLNKATMDSALSLIHI